MTNKHLEAFAQYIWIVYSTDGKLRQAEQLANMVCFVAKEFNPRFNESKFMNKALGT